MTEIVVETLIAAPMQQCFDRSRCVEDHLQSTAQTAERIVAGRTDGLLELGDEVTWEGKHLGVRQRLTSRITAMDQPRYFQDVMIRGVFKQFEHDHFFEQAGSGTRMVDIVRFTAPYGWLGTFVERFILKRYLIRFLCTRATHLKLVAERMALGS